jgi:hypothetical protein
MITTYTVFEDTRQIATGPLTAVLPPLKKRFDESPGKILLVFEDHSGKQVDFDLRGSLDDVLSRYKARVAAVGRPKLGVVSREVTLLPRHWEWLDRQPSGASATIRRLVEQARKQDPAAERLREAIDATSRFLTAIAGNLPGYEEATRALYRQDWPAFHSLTAGWPGDIRTHADRLIREAQS